MESQCVQRIHAFMLSGLTSMPARGGASGWEVGWVQGDLQGSISVARQRSTHQPAIHPQQNAAARTAATDEKRRPNPPHLNSSPPDTTTPMSSTMFMMSDAVPAEELPTVTARDMAPIAAGGGVGEAPEGGGRSAGRQGGGFAETQPSGNSMKGGFATGALEPGFNWRVHVWVWRHGTPPAAKVDTTNRKVATTAELDCRPICRMGGSSRGRQLRVGLSMSRGPGRVWRGQAKPTPTMPYARPALWHAAQHSQGPGKERRAHHRVEGCREDEDGDDAQQQGVQHHLCQQVGGGPVVAACAGRGAQQGSAVGKAAGAAPCFARRWVLHMPGCLQACACVCTPAHCQPPPQLAAC